MDFRLIHKILFHELVKESTKVSQFPTHYEWEQLIESNNLGVKYVFNTNTLSSNDYYHTYVVTNEHKWLVTKIKYGIF